MSNTEFVPCHNWVQKLSDLHSHNLSPSDQRALEAHLTSCQECTAVLLEYQEMDELIHQALNREPLPLLASKLPGARKKAYNPRKEVHSGGYLSTAVLSISRGLDYLPTATISISMSKRAYRITYFVTVQLIALIGWIIVQSLFSLSPISSSLSFTVKLVIEAIWWIATLVIMFLLFRRVYNGFVQSVLELEEANKKLREKINTSLFTKLNDEMVNTDG